MKFTPGPPSLDPVLAPMPLARAVHLQAGGIDHKMTRWFTGTPSDLDGQGRRPAAERAVVWNGHSTPNNGMIDRINPSRARNVSNSRSLYLDLPFKRKVIDHRIAS